jgi:pyrroloquinoline quinone biosynthesis protein B
VAVSADGRRWWLLNVSPDIRQQILAFPPLGPAEGVRRGQGIVGCVLTDAEIDHTTGLLFLREGSSFAVLATPLVRRWLSQQFPVEPLLACFARPAWMTLPLDQPRPLPGDDALMLQAFEVEPHIPRFAPGRLESAAGSVVGLRLTDTRTGGTLVYAPCVGALGERLRQGSVDADVVFLDGTFWSDDEPIHAGIGTRSARDMGHLPVRGGSLDWLSGLPAKHRVYVHINNTNPMLNEQGPEFRLVRDCGVRVGVDRDMFSV